MNTTFRTYCKYNNLVQLRLTTNFRNFCSEIQAGEQPFSFSSLMYKCILQRAGSGRPGPHDMQHWLVTSGRFEQVRKRNLDYETLKVANNENVILFSVTPRSLVSTKHNLVRLDWIWTITANTDQPEKISADQHREHTVPVPSGTAWVTRPLPWHEPRSYSDHRQCHTSPDHSPTQQQTHIFKYAFCNFYTALTFLFILYCRYSRNRYHLPAVFGSLLYFAKCSRNPKKCSKCHSIRTSKIRQTQTHNKILQGGCVQCRSGYVLGRCAAGD
jgi:hypothetical protein